MPYEYLDDIATADVAFRATGHNLEEMFRAAGDAVLNVMLEDLGDLTFKQTLLITLDAGSVDMLLFEFLQELVYLKDAQQLLLRAGEVNIREKDNRAALTAQVRGEKIAPRRHHLSVDVKAVTMHQFRVREVRAGEWEAVVVLDI